MAHCVPARQRSRGFTIVELMLAVLIVGVLSAVAVAGYGHYREKIRRQTAIQDIAMMSVVIRALCEEDRVCPPALPASLAGRLDPWGNPYQYLSHDAGPPGHARKDHSLVPINSDFDLYSMGPDGRSSPPLTARASRDDIVRASDGKFIGVAADY